MPHNTYIKDLDRFPAGATRSLQGVSDVITYKNSTNYVTLTSNTVVDDGTGLNDLVKYRLKFENPSYIINSPTTISFLQNFILNKTVGHTVLSNKFIWQQFRGATAMFISFVSGNPESQPARTRNGSWGNIFSSKFWICRFLPWFGFRRDKKKCYRYNYRKDASFTVYVEGGYGDPSHLVVSLSFGNGSLISTQRPDANGRVTFSNLWGSINDDRNPGAYIIQTGDISLGYSHVTRMFVPYQPAGSTFTHSRTSAGISQSFSSGTTHVPGINNAIWANAPAAAAPPSADLLAADIDDDEALSTCDTNRVNFIAEVDEYFSGNINWRISFKLNNSSTWTNIGAFQTIAAASLSIPNQISAFADIPTNDYGGLWRVEITSPTGNITFDKIYDGSLASFELIPPDIEITWNNLTQASTPIIAIPPTTKRNYTITANYSAFSCKAFKAELLRWNGDVSSSLTEGMPLSAPLAGFTVVASQLHAGKIDHINKNLTNTLLSATPGTVFTYALRCNGTVTPFLETFPQYIRTPATTDPDTGAVIASDINFRVVTLA